MTQPTRAQYRAIFKKATELAKEEEKMDKALQGLLGVLAPSNSGVFMESTKVKAFSDGLEIVFPEISDSISYWVYEFPYMRRKGPVVCTDSKGKKYNVKKLEEYISFLLAG